MGILDDAKNKAQEFMNQNPDKVEELSDQGLDKASDAADGATGGKYGDQIDAARDKADDAIGE